MRAALVGARSPPCVGCPARMEDGRALGPLSAKPGGRDGAGETSPLLQYAPGARLNALGVCAHGFFDELRAPGMRLPSGQHPPPLFNFRSGELDGAPPELRARILPAAMR